MLKVCPYKCKESSDLNFRGKLKAIHSAYLIFNMRSRWRNLLLVSPDDEVEKAEGSKEK